ncbi:RES family NAD+ phosphorylase [Lysobacter firmicutimachus]|uniref:RES family NAD+ phosphorylase n=1 Tax=Lysobacter firmicutimachus TaxID=1792846 RepID=A0ABU8CWG7_9GAMM
MKQISEAQIADRIRAVSELDLLEATYPFVKQHVDAIFPGYACLTRFVHCSPAWRARKNHGADLFHNVSELWYPKPEYVRTFGRMNQPNKPMFYISASHQTAVLEVRPSPGDLVTVLELGLKSGADLPHVMEIGTVEKASQYNLPSTANILENTVGGQAYLGGEVNKNLLIRSFLAKEVTQIIDLADTHRFKVSAAICDQLISSAEIDGIEYPSMAGDGTASGGGVNLAVKPVSADRLFRPVGCFVVRVVSSVLRPTPGLLVECINVAKAILPDGSIDWA